LITSKSNLYVKAAITPPGTRTLSHSL